jgi:hypothetical protein
MGVMTDIALAPDAGWDHRVRFESRPNAALAARAAGVPVLDVVVPVYNEQAALADSIYRLHRHLRENFPFPARITIADNASVDETPWIAAELAAELTDVRVVRLEQKGRGRCGPPRTRRCWPTWTSTCPPTSRRSRRWWRR